MRTPTVDGSGPYGYEPRELPWNPPATVDPNDAGLARNMIPAYEAFLKPAPKSWISGRVATLMAHYYTPDMPQALAGAVLRDWADLLAEFPGHAIQEAAQKWLRTETRKRPTPGDIREMCQRLVGEEIKVLKRLRSLAERVDPDRARVGGVVTTLARHLDRSK